MWFTGLIDEEEAAMAAMVQLDDAYYNENADGLIPELWWKTEMVDPYVAGFIDGIWETLESTYGIAKFLWAWQPANSTSEEAIDIRIDTYQFVLLLNDLAKSKKLRRQIVNQIKQSFLDYLDETTSLSTQGKYNQGKLLFDVLTIFIGVYEVKAILKGEKVALQIVKQIKNLPKHLTGIILKAQRLGLKISRSGDDLIKLISKQGDEILKISDDALYVTKHEILSESNSVVLKNADKVNNSYPKGWEAPYVQSVPPVEFKTKSPNEQFVRVFTKGVNNPDGRWLMKKSEIEGLTPAQIKDKFAIPGDELPDKIVDVNLPKGTRIRTGKAGSTSGGDGGGTQFELPYPDEIDENWFVNERSL